MSTKLDVGNTPSAALEEGYEVISVEPADTPDDLEGSGWNRYMIAQGKNTICGYRQGSLASVQEAIEELVLRLNERRLGKRGRAYLDTSKKKQARGGE